MADEIEEAVDDIVDDIESEAKRLGVSAQEIADRVKAEIAARGES